MAWEWSQREAVRHRLEPPQAMRLGRAESSRDIGGRAANEPISKYFLLDATRDPSTPLSFAQDDMDESGKMIGVDFQQRQNTVWLEHRIARALTNYFKHERDQEKSLD